MADRMNSTPSTTDSSSIRAGTRDWSQRCAFLFEDLRRPARNMVARAYGRSLTDEEIEDIYAAAWAATLSALRDRGNRMADEELRAYVLTAVASHASKELRRRSRRPAGQLDTAHDQVVSDVHLPLPEEAAIGSESRSVARDLLLSLPPRRRAVMLLRYGWGLSPKEICALVEGLSPRAYRKEVTKGVDQLIDRLKQVETGEWCESREPLLRDYVAGTASNEERRQVEEHLRHCRACSQFTGSLSGHLHDLGSGLGLASAAGVIGGKLGFFERVASFVEGGRSAANTAVERGEGAVASIAASGAGRGSGAAGAGLLTKLAATGAAGKAAIACIGTGAAATACVAAGVVPGVSLNGKGADERDDRAAATVERSAERVSMKAQAETAITGVVASASTPAATPAQPPPEPVPVQSEEAEGGGSNGSASGEAEVQPVTAAPAVTAAEEFDPVAPAPTTTPAAPPAVSPAPEPSSGSASGSSGSGASSVAGNEFGP